MLLFKTCWLFVVGEDAQQRQNASNQVLNMTIFLFKLTLCWGFFALLYTLLLRYETFFRANRVYLLGTVALGILLAALPGEQIPVPVEGGDLLTSTLPEFSVGVQQVEAATSGWEDIGFLWIVYWAGCVLMAVRVLWGLFKIAQMAVRGQSERLQDGCLLVHTAEAKVPFSFFTWVFVPHGGTDFSPSGKGAFTPLLTPHGVVNDAYPDGLKSIPPYALMLAHERAHAQGWHSVDVLFAEVLCVVFWFHPLAHWYRQELRTVHEYLADAEASRLSDRKQYGLLLIGQSQSGMPIAFANHFFQSPLKQRLVMLTKKASAPVRAVKFGLLAPLALLFALLFRQASAIAQVVDEKHRAFVHQLEANNWTAIDTVYAFNPDTHEEKVHIVTNSLAPEADENGKLVYQYAEIQPQFPGGQEAMLKFLRDNVKYPELAQKNKLEGTVVVSFVVDESGKVTRVSGKMDMPNDVKQPLIDEAVRVVKSMPKWIPAQHKGKTVRCSLCIPVNFVSAKLEANTAEVTPEFPGGMEALFKFLGENIRYPETARTANAEGIVVVQFMVKEDGSLTEFKQANTGKSLHPDLVAEAIRVVQSMPKWKPGLKDGKVVKTSFTLPIKFKLSDDK